MGGGDTNVGTPLSNQMVYTNDPQYVLSTGTNYLMSEGLDEQDSLIARMARKKNTKEDSKSMIVQPLTGSVAQTQQQSNKSQRNSEIRTSKSVKYQMQTETNVDLLSRDDSVMLGMGRMSNRNKLNASELDNSVSMNGGGGGKRNIQSRMSGKRMNRKNEGGACNPNCEQVCIIF